MRRSFHVLIQTYPRRQRPRGLANIAVTSKPCARRDGSVAVDRATDIFVQEDSRESNPQPGILVPRNLLRFAVIHRRQPTSQPTSIRRVILFRIFGRPWRRERTRALRSLHNPFCICRKWKRGGYNAQDAYRTITSLLFCGSRKILRAQTVRRL